MALFSTIPAEIVVRMMLGCDDFSQLFSFVSTCKDLYLVWMSNFESIIWDMGIRSFLCFDDALIAVSSESNLLYMSDH